MSKLQGSSAGHAKLLALCSTLILRIVLGLPADCNYPANEPYAASPRSRTSRVLKKQFLKAF